jgi:hypothetical protein
MVDETQFVLEEPNFLSYLEQVVSPMKPETPFIFEEPKWTYFKLEIVEWQALLLLGPMAPQWLTHIERVHVVHPPLFKTQVTVARHLDVPHYQATMTIHLCLEASFHHDPPGDKKDQALYYEKTRKAIVKEIPDTGSLIMNHLMAVFAIVGLVPLWFVEEHTVNTSSKSMDFLVVKKGLVKGKLAVQRFLDSLSCWRWNATMELFPHGGSRRMFVARPSA